MPCKEILKLSKEEIKEFLDSFDCVMSDCDGVLWHINNVIEDSEKVVQEFRKLKRRVFFCTNNSTKSRQDYVEKCKILGFDGELDEMIGTSYLAATYLNDIGYKGKCYAIGCSGLHKELELAGIKCVGGIGPDPVPEGWKKENSYDVCNEYKDVDCVVCGFDEHFSYLKMLKATTILARKNTLYVATNTDEQFPVSDDLIFPGTGAFISCIQTSSGREPVIIGKPSKMMFEFVKKVHPEINANRTLMIGDRANTDILMGKNCNLKTLMVGTGVNSLEDIRQWESSGDPEKQKLCADYYIPKLGDLLPFLKEFYP